MVQQKNPTFLWKQSNEIFRMATSRTHKIQKVSFFLSERYFQQVQKQKSKIWKRGKNEILFKGNRKSRNQIVFPLLPERTRQRQRSI